MVPVWKLEFKDMKGVPVPRLRAYPRRRIWIVAAVFVITTVLWAYLYPPQDYTNPVRDWFPSEPTRELTDQETAARVVFRQILSTPPFISRNPKIAFMFLTPGLLPFERLWELFFKGREGRYTIYVHASREKPEHVGWGMISMVDAERRLLAKALEDIDNQHFVLLSDSCVPLHNFDYVYDFLMGSRHSFLDCFNDPGPHGVFRYSKICYLRFERQNLGRAHSGSQLSGSMQWRLLQTEPLLHKVQALLQGNPIPLGGLPSHVVRSGNEQRNFSVA